MKIIIHFKVEWTLNFLQLKLETPKKMLKKNTLKKDTNSNSNTNTNTNTISRNSRSTRSTTSNGATVLKPIYPAIPHNQTHKKINVEDSSFLLPSSEFFVVDKDSLLLSESDIFQTNQARRNIAPSTSIISSSPGKVDIFMDDEDYNFENDDADEDEKENENIVSNLNNNFSNGGLLLNPSSSITSKASVKKPANLSNTASPATSNIANVTHVPTSQSNQQLDKGLRHFSAKVCAKVEAKGITTYNEVADDLVQEIGLEIGKCDHKNIRRRVYDALNVLMAIDIICKEKKEIRWLGLPNEAADDLKALEAERAALQERINEKNRNLKEVLRRCISLKNLIDRNASDQHHQQGDKLPLPFILISAARDCHVHCEMLEDRTQYFFEFNTAFQINEDIELMRLMGLDTARIERIKSFFPKELVAQVLMLCLNLNNNTNNPNNVNSSGADNVSAVNSSVFAPIINNDNLNLGDLESFSSSSSL